MKKKRKPYSQRTDIEKIKSNWRKSRGLFERGEYSVSIIRAATVLELAANLVIRKELVEKKTLPPNFVDALLVWANGLKGKIHKIILPILAGQPGERLLRPLLKDIDHVNNERNGIVHRGEFKQKRTARECLKSVHRVVTTVIGQYENSFHLKPLENNNASKKRHGARTKRSY